MLESSRRCIGLELVRVKPVFIKKFTELVSFLFCREIAESNSLQGVIIHRLLSLRLLCSKCMCEKWCFVPPGASRSNPGKLKYELARKKLVVLNMIYHIPHSTIYYNHVLLMCSFSTEFSHPLQNSCCWWCILARHHESFLLYIHDTISAPSTTSERQGKKIHSTGLRTDTNPIIHAAGCSDICRGGRQMIDALFCFSRRPSDGKKILERFFGPCSSEIL